MPNWCENWGDITHEDKAKMEALRIAVRKRMTTDRTTRHRMPGSLRGQRYGITAPMAFRSAAWPARISGATEGRNRDISRRN